MKKSLINTQKVFFLLLMFVFACFNNSVEKSDLPDRSNAIVSDSVKDSIEALDYTILKNQIYQISDKMSDHLLRINNLEDSLKTFQQIGITGDTTDKDIINSLIRIQTKLNLIEEKLFYSDSLYFNLLNDLIIIDSQIEDLNQNINNISDLSFNREEGNDNSTNFKIENYKISYDMAVEYYMNKEYDRSFKLFVDLVEFQTDHSLSDNAQFWIGQILYLKKDYNKAIEAYNEVLALGDKNKSADAEYKIALSYFNLNLVDRALQQFASIILNYPDKTDLVSKSKKYIERYK